MSGDLMRPVPGQDFRHLVFYPQLELLQTGLFSLVFRSQAGLRLDGLELLVLLRMLFSELAISIVRGHQVRLQFFLSADALLQAVSFHVGRWSHVTSRPPQAANRNMTLT